MNTTTTPTAPTRRPGGGPAIRSPRPSPWDQLLTLARALLRSFLRDRTTLLFTFAFPLMFLAIFGLLFRSGSNPTETAVVGDGPVVSSLPPDVFAVQRFDSLEAAVAKVRSGDLPAVVAQPATPSGCAMPPATRSPRPPSRASSARRSPRPTSPPPASRPGSMPTSGRSKRPTPSRSSTSPPASWPGGWPPRRSSVPPSRWSAGAESSCCAGCGWHPPRCGRSWAPASASACLSPWPRPRCSSGSR